MLKRIILSGLLLAVLGTVNTYAQFAGGSGTEADPYQVSTVEELQAIRDYPDKHFIQIDNINASSTETWNDSLGFDPIGDDLVKFSGSYDGKSYTFIVYISIGKQKVILDFLVT